MMPRNNKNFRYLNGIFFTFLILTAVNAVIVPEDFSDIATSTDEVFIPDYESAKAVKEYVRMHLVSELSETSEIIQTANGKNRLIAWLKKRNSLIKKFLFFRDHDTNTLKLFSNWYQRLQYFQKAQMDYLRTIAKKFDVRRREGSYGDLSWPKITFFYQSGESILLDDNSDLSVIDHNLADPIATDKDVDHVLRFHRPYSKEEIIQQQDLAVRKKKNTEEKYYVINKGLIRKLQVAHYELLRKSLMGKRMSELKYQERLFQADRIMAAWDVSRMKDFHFDKKNNGHKLFETNLIDNDELYRRYMNFDDAFFQGNLMYGPPNRYDDPTKHGFTFEVTSKPVIGKLFQPMCEIHNEILKLSHDTADFTMSKIQHLPALQFILERYRFLTFWFPQSRYQEEDWKTIKFSKGIWPWSNIHLSLVIPKNYKQKSRVEILNKMNEILANEIRKPFIKDDSVIDWTKRFQKQTFKDFSFITSNNVKIFDSKNVFTNRVINHFNSINAEVDSPSLQGHQQQQKSEMVNKNTKYTKNNLNENQLKQVVEDVASTKKLYTEMVKFLSDSFSVQYSRLSNSDSDNKFGSGGDVDEINIKKFYTDYTHKIIPKKDSSHIKIFHH